jgi:thiol:disulfide interchange protein
MIVGLALFYSFMMIFHRFIYFTEVQNNRKIHAQSAVNFEEDNFQVSLRKAKKEHKLIFLDIYTGWCAMPTF